MVMELMGHHAGWLALHSGIAGGGDLILIPEIDYDEDKVAEYIENRSRSGKPYSIVVVAEGIKMEVQKKKRKKKSAGYYIAKSITKRTDLETRVTVLGYIQRGGTPTPYDRILASRYGAHAVDLIANEEFGNMVCLKDNKISAMPLEETAGKLNTVSPEDYLVHEAKSLGTSFGN